MTVTFWYRHIQCAAGESCGAYVLHATGSGGAECQSVIWSLWIESDGIWFDNVKGSPKYQYPLNFMHERSKWSGDRVWRHVAFSLDENKDTFVLYMDGLLAVERPWGSAVRSTDCAARSVALGHASPGWTYGAEMELFDMRFYAHNAAAGLQGVLMQQEIQRLAQAATPQLAVTSGAVLQPGQGPKCLPPDSFQDYWADPSHMFADQYGYGCEDYNFISDTFPDVCYLEKIRETCKLACPSTQECFMPLAQTHVYYIWDRVRRIEAQVPNGTICLGSASTPRRKAEVVRECEAWVKAAKNGGSIVPPALLEPWLGSAMGASSKTPRIDLADCARVGAAIDDYCDFDIDQVD
jgi:hypothetical protein